MLLDAVFAAAAIRTGLDVPQDGQHHGPTDNRNLELGTRTILNAPRGIASVLLGLKTASRIRIHGIRSVHVWSEKRSGYWLQNWYKIMPLTGS